MEVITLKGLNLQRLREEKETERQERVGESEESDENWPERIKLAMLE